MKQQTVFDVLEERRKRRGEATPLYSVKPNESVLDAVQVMVEQKVNSLLVTDRGHTHGIITEVQKKKNKK